MKDDKNTKSKVELGGIFYPTKDKDGKDVIFDSLYLPYIWKEIYLESVYIDIFNTKKDMVVIDIGAQIGLVTQYMRNFAKIVYSVEPSTESFTALKKNVEYNKWTNVVPIKAAIAEKNGEMTLNLNNNNRTCHSLNMNYGQGGEKVRVMDFETLFKENNIDKVDFVKSDVEGYEDVIYRSESFLKVAPKINAIMMEMHFPTFPKLVEHMLSLGYKARRYDSSAIVILFYR